ncbi:MAG TPA: N-acetylglucosamine-6-phosphate deacetylase [Polyangia bacterium]|jgi:N-acetylglucosamine-6-phosphate deacetylase|nr:N-acetylglucosamine-6-phosphate deacetylase [Polyangia bacterium]
MTSRRELTGNILGPTGWVRGRLAFAERIEVVDAVPVDPASNDDPYVLPGFIDLHVHGGGGADLMHGVDAAATVGELHARHGTTALMATTVTSAAVDMEAVVGELGRACVKKPAAGARLLGVHLEGPYISAGNLGAQPNHARVATLAELETLLRLAPVRILTLAPEVPGHLEIIGLLTQRGIRVQVGHTNGTYDDGVAALRHGASGFTHLYNAMTGLHHREPGVVGAALAHAEYAELIPDLLHVHPGGMRTALRAIPRLFCVTDSTSAAGMPDGQYLLGPRPVTKFGGSVRLPDGTLAGSALTMDRALRNLVSIGLSIEDASHRLSRYPAEYLGLKDRGRIVPGAHADLVLLDRQLELERVIGEGNSLWDR